MTRKEAIKVLKNGGIEVCGEADRISEFIAALDVALDALIPPTRENELEAENRELKERIVNWRKYMAPTREQVEKVWRGEWNVIYDELNGFTYVTCSKCRDETVLNGCFVTVEGEPCDLEDFCPHCGAPMTDEAMQMVMERMEAVYEQDND